MTLEQATTLLALTQTLHDSLMFLSGLVAALIFAVTWKG